MNTGSIHAETMTDGMIAVVIEDKYGDMTRKALTVEGAKALREELDTLIRQEEFLERDALGQ